MTDETTEEEASPAAQWFQFMMSIHDPRPRIWDFPQGSPPLEQMAGHRHFPERTDARWRITIADMYQARRPFLFSPGAVRGMLAGRQVAIACEPVALLDSQVLDAVHHYRTAPEKLLDREAVRDFLLFLVERGFDPSPVFYYYEATARAQDPRHWKEIARERAETVVALQTLDRRRFLASNGDQFASDPRGEELQLAHSGASSVGELVARYAGIADGTAAGVASDVRFSYASLLKTALIQQGRRNRPIPERFRLLREFMETELGVMLGPERNVAILYFARPSDLPRFLPDLGARPNFTRFLGYVRSASWDLLLLRLPENTLGGTGRSPVVADASCVLPYLCTADGTLRRLATSRVIQTVFEFPAELGGRRVIAGHTTGMFGGAVPDDVIDAISEENTEWDARRVLKGVEPTPLEPGALDALIARLEAKVAALCQPGT